MKFKTALFYKGAIVYYNIFRLGNNLYKVKLDSYNGNTHPPELIEIYKEGQTWHSSCNEMELIKELSAAIEQKNK